MVTNKIKQLNQHGCIKINSRWMITLKLFKQNLFKSSRSKYWNLIKAWHDSTTFPTGRPIETGISQCSKLKKKNSSNTISNSVFILCLFKVLHTKQTLSVIGAVKTTYQHRHQDYEWLGTNDYQKLHLSSEASLKLGVFIASWLWY